MSSPETPGPVAQREIRRYISDVDDLLLDIPWQQRRELIAGLTEHLQGNPEQIRTEPPGEYAAELRETATPSTPGLFAGLRSIYWPSPLQWWESVIRGTALMLVVWVVYDFVAALTQSAFGEQSPDSWSTMLDTALTAAYPVPTLHGSRRAGLLAFVLSAVLAGQLTTAAVLSRAPHLRPRLRLLTGISIGVVVTLLGYGAATAG